jgi:hypothetical protein
MRVRVCVCVCVRVGEMQGEQCESMYVLVDGSLLVSHTPPPPPPKPRPGARVPPRRAVRARSPEGGTGGRGGALTRGARPRKAAGGGKAAPAAVLALLDEDGGGGGGGGGADGARGDGPRGGGRKGKVMKDKDATSPTLRTYYDELGREREVRARGLVGSFVQRVARGAAAPPGMGVTWSGWECVGRGGVGRRGWREGNKRWDRPQGPMPTACVCGKKGVCSVQW